jgi:hypothetical protein
MSLWYLFVVCKLFVLVWHHLLTGKTSISLYFKKKAENFLFFSPRVYKISYIRKSVKTYSESIRLFTKDMVKLHARFLPPKGDQPIIIFFHGQSENITKWQDTFDFYRNNGYGALFLSFRGHYKSAGRPSEEGIYIDAQTAVEYLKDKGFSEENIILWGRSLGSTVAVETALKYNVKAVILESAILDIKSGAISVFSRYIKIFKFVILKRFIKWLLENAHYVQNFSNYDKISKIKCPLLIMHAKNDEKINYEQSVKLASNNKNAQLFLVEEGSHDHADWCYEEAKRFIESL